MKDQGPQNQSKMDPKLSARTPSIVSTKSAVKPESITKGSSTTQRLKSNDYKGWDKFNVDRELAKIDLSKKVSAPSIIALDEKHAIIPDGLNDHQIAVFSENEKYKGNDCLRSQEFDQALYHYTTSLKLLPTSAVYNNRALAYLKLTNYTNSIADSTASLAIQINFKAYLRRSSAYFSSGKYQDAIVDVDLALEMDKDNKEASNLRQKIMDKWMDSDGTVPSTRTAKPARKMKIEEVEELPEGLVRNQNFEPYVGPKIVEIFEDEEKHVKRNKVQITEVEDESDSESD